MPSEVPSGPIVYELDNGRLITMPPPGDFHCAVELKFAGALLYLGEMCGLGKARVGDVGIILRRNPDRLVGADAAFITNRRLPLCISAEGYLETIPELIVEVRSKNDTWPEIRRKVTEYLAAGVLVVWVPDPQARTVTEFRPNQPDHVYLEDDTLTVPDVIPGFSLAVREALKE
jgi:Uma2 family endonuclease